MNIKPYKFLHGLKVLYSIRNLPYNYGCWIISVTENMRQSFPEWPYMVVRSSVLWKPSKVEMYIYLVLLM